MLDIAVVTGVLRATSHQEYEAVDKTIKRRFDFASRWMLRHVARLDLVARTCDAGPYAVLDHQHRSQAESPGKAE